MSIAVHAGTGVIASGAAILWALPVAPSDARSANIGFSSPTSYVSADQYSDSQVAADLNHDGRDDLIVGGTDTEGGADKMTVLVARPGGHFVRHGVHGDEEGPIAVSDFNRDGDPDVVRLSDEVAVLRLGDGHGGLGSARRYPLGISTAYGSPALAGGDFNGDHAPDLVVTRRRFYGERDPLGRLLLGTGDGALSPAEAIELGRSPTSVSTADFNGDDIADLAVGDAAAGGAVRVFRGDGDGGFVAGARYDVGRAPDSLMVGAFNRDRKPDLILSLNANRRNRGVRLMLGNGAGGFRTSKRYATTTLGDLAVADFDRDGRLDVASVGVVGDRRLEVRIWRGNGRGTLMTPLRFNAGRCDDCSPGPPVAGRFNGDRRPDLAVARGTDSGVAVLLNQRR
jgi:hypothetical protein